MSDGLARIQTILAGNPDFHCRIPAADVRPEHRFRQDLGMDSLGLIGLLYELQEDFPQLEEKLIASWQTVADALRSLD